MESHRAAGPDGAEKSGHPCDSINAPIERSPAVYNPVAHALYLMSTMRGDAEPPKREREEPVEEPNMGAPKRPRAGE